MQKVEVMRAFNPEVLKLGRNACPELPDIP